MVMGELGNDCLEVVWGERLSGRTEDRDQASVRPNSRPLGSPVRLVFFLGLVVGGEVRLLHSNHLKSFRRCVRSSVLTLSSRGKRDARFD